MQAAPGAALTVQGYGFAPRSSFELLIVGNDSGIESSLGTSTTDTNGGLTLAATLPALSPGVYSVVVNNRSRTPTIALTVLAAPTISLNLTAGQPGTIVEFTVDHLLAGSLRLDYAGVPVFGPTPVAAGSFHNLFVVPQDRPAVLGERVIVSAYNLVSGRSVGRGETVFESQTPSAPIRYTLNQIKLPEGELDAGEFFTVSGRITPAPLELTGMSLRLLWKTGAGAVFPITQGTPQIAEDGAFHVQGHVPTLMAGDPAPADSGAQVGVVLLTGDKGNATLVGYTPYGPIKPVPKFIVKVVDENNAPVPNAIVDIRAPYAADATSTDGQAIAFSSATLGQNNQVVQALVNQLPSGETDPFDCPASATHGRTDANGEFAFQFDPEKVSIMGTYYVLDPTHPDKKFQFPTEVEFPLTVNALYTGHGQMVNNKPTAYQLQVRYSSITRSFYDVAAN
ncbi:MAG: hypothetical protein ACK2UK_21105, partial [Candidatus Promineifilaceae bacterium]